MKKLFHSTALACAFALSFSLSLFSSDHDHEISAATVVNAQIAQAQSALGSLQEDFLDALDYKAKRITLDISLFDRLKILYTANLGYKGAGKENIPFSGFSGNFTLPLTIAKGLIIDPLQAERMQEIAQMINLDRYTNVSAADEFRFKFFQLLTSVAQNTISQEKFAREVRILVQRASRTPSIEELSFGNLRLLGTAADPGYIDTLLSFPDETQEKAFSWIYRSIQKISSRIGLGEHEKKSIDTQENDYKTSTDFILFDDPDASAKIDFGYHGAGNASAPMTGAHLDLSFPCAQGFNLLSQHMKTQSSIQLPLHFSLRLDPTYEYLCKVFSLLGDARKQKIALHEVVQELEILSHRLLLAEEKTDIGLSFGTMLSWKLIGTEKYPGPVRLFAEHSYDIIHYDFEATDTNMPLSPREASLNLTALLYKVFADMSDVRTKLVGEISATTKGSSLLKNLHEALHIHTVEQTRETKRKLDRMWRAYRSTEIYHGKEDFQEILDFAMIQIARMCKRLPALALGKQALLGIPFLYDLERGNVSLNFDLFWNELGRSGEGETK